MSPVEFEKCFKLFQEHYGEANLFVIRKIGADSKERLSFLITYLEKYYEIIQIKPIDWKFRWFHANKMRGGKWRRGGKPYYAIVVFDHNPIIRQKDDMAKIHPMVFNATQFFKPKLREEFADKFGVKLKLNPLHSTDNEFEAWDHLPLFFTEDEINIINEMVNQRRKNAIH